MNLNDEIKQALMEAPPDAVTPEFIGELQERVCRVIIKYFGPANSDWFKFTIRQVDDYGILLNPLNVPTMLVIAGHPAARDGTLPTRLQHGEVWIDAAGVSWRSDENGVYTLEPTTTTDSDS